MPTMHDPGDMIQNLRLARGKHPWVWDAVLADHRDRLRKFVQLRMHRRLAGRVDPSDVIQEAYLEASRTLDRYLQAPPLPIFLWLRHITSRKLTDLHRKHLGARRRDAGREVPLGRGLQESAWEVPAKHLLANLISPSQAILQSECRARLQHALKSLAPNDREILALRHFEQLSNAEVARVLQINASAASKRYVRALERLHDVLGASTY
jgi:RNA polymerase sigma-70 factor (ECF subfamily)